MLRDDNLVKFRKILNSGKYQGNKNVLIIEIIKLIII